MTKTGVLFIAQNMMVCQYRDAVILLGIEAADPRQSVTNADLKPGLIQSVFQTGNNRIAQIICQYAQRLAFVIRLVVERNRLPCHQVLVAERLIQITQPILNGRFAFHRLQVLLINKTDTETKAEFVIVGIGLDDAQHLPLFDSTN